MVKLVCIIIIVGASMLSPCSANATTLAHLYEVSVPVFTQSAEERKQAIHQAFAELLVRVTGKRDVLSLKSGQTLLKKSRRYVRSFRYEILPPPMVFEKDEPSDAEAPVLPAAEINEPVPVAPAPEPGQKIVVFFDEIAVKNSLWKQALPVWGKTRPSTLLWVAIQDGDGRKMLDIAKPTAISEKIKLESEKRGVPFVYPKLDLRDQAEINISDVWGTYEEPVKNASARYKTEAVISARFSFDPAQGWETYWRLHQGIEETHWRVTEADLNVVIAESIDKLASVLADRYAQISIASGADRFIIRIKNVSNLTDYEKVNSYLAAIPVIKQAELVQIQSDELIYKLTLRTDPKALKQAIALGSILSEQEDPFAEELDVNRLNYRFIP